MHIHLNKDAPDYLSSISGVKTQFCSVKYPTEFEYLEQIRTRLSVDCRYSLVGDSTMKENESLKLLIESKLGDSDFDQLFQIKLVSIDIGYKLSQIDYMFIGKLLNIPAIQNHLEVGVLIIKNLSFAIHILDRLSSCPNIKRISLRYNSNEDFPDLIKQSLQTFTKKVGLIPELSIKR